MTKKIVTALACSAMLFTVSAQAEILSSSLSLDFSDGSSKFTPKSRVTCTVEDEVQLITAANNAGNGYTLAYYDFSDISKGADRVEVEFDSQIESGSRYWVSLYDTANRGTEAAGSSKSTYNTDYLIYTAGTGDGTYYRANGTSVSNAFDDMVHTSVTVDFNTNKVSYTVTSSAGTKLLAKSEQDFYNLEKKAEECTGIEFYTWQNDAVAKIDNLSVKAYVNGSNVDNTVDLSKFDAQGSYDSSTGTESLTLGTKKWSKLDLTPYTSSDDYIKNITVSYKETISGTGRTAVGFYDNDKAVWATNAYQDTVGGALVYGITGSNYSRRIYYYNNGAGSYFNGTFGYDAEQNVSLSFDLENNKVSGNIGSQSFSNLSTEGIDSIDTLGVYSWSDTTYKISDMTVTVTTGERPEPTPEPIEIPNGDFSDGANSWTVSNISKLLVSNGALNVASTSGEGKISQTLTGIENGKYDVTATVTGSMPSTSDAAYVFAKAPGHTMARTAVPYYTTATTITVPNVTVDNGTLDIGLYVNGTQTIILDNFVITASDSTRVPFLKGGEISKLTYIEDKGGVFHTSDGTAKDGLQIMAEQGFNLARIRVLNNPGPNNGNGYYYLPSGYQNEADCLEMAKRAKDKGMQIEFTFAYSDWWTDGGEQYVPNDWETTDYTGAELSKYYSDKIYAYTKQVLQDLKAQDTEPEFVSIGNEMQCGMLFDDWQNNNGLYYNATYLTEMLNAGAKAVREVCPDAKIILHTDNGGRVASTRTLFTSILKNVDFDVIGVSFYPYYSSAVSIDTVVNEFNTFVKTYDKDVIIMETGFNWSEKRGDGYEGQLQDNGYYQNSYGESQQGQKAFLTELYAKIKTVLGGRCIGDLYWDPIMLYDGGKYNIGWAINSSGYTQGNVVSNSNLFDFSSNALPAFDAMKYNTDADDKVLVTGKITAASSGSGGNKGSGSNASVANTDITVNINGTAYSTTTDAYGEYIVAVDYPSNEKLYITVDGYIGSYAVAAPADGVLVSDINFPAVTTAAPVYNNDMAVFNTYDEGYSGTATALTFSVTPYDGINSLSVKDDKENSVVYDDLPSITGTSQIVFGVIYPDIVGADIFNVNVQ